MAETAHGARRACGTALMALGCTVLTCSIIYMAALMFMERAAMQPTGNPRGEASDPEEPDSGNAAGDSEDVSIDWDYWLAVNPDIVAWIRIPGTGIDLPVAKPPDGDPRRYLSCDVYGKWNLCGCPYVDAACEGGTDARNVIIYGHNLGDDAMFGSLVNYRDPEWAHEHRTIQLITPAGTRKLEFAGCRTVEGSTEEKRASFANSLEFDRYVEETAAACDSWGVAPNALQSRLYTLCTCSYISNPANERTLVYAFETDEGMARS